MSGTVARYAVAVVAAVAAIALRVSLSGRIVGTFLLAYPPVFLAAAVGGLGPGIVATGLTALLAWLWVIRPSHPLAPLSHEESLGLVVFVLMGVLVSWMSEALRRSRGRAAQLEGERAVWESEARQRSVVAAMSEGVVVHDAAGAITLFNDSALRILGLTRDELTGRTSLDPRWSTVHEDGSPFPGDAHPAMETLRTGSPTHCVGMGVKRPDGNVSWIEINTEPVRDLSGKVTSVVATFSDVTERRRLDREREESRRALAASEVRFRALADQAPIGIVEIDPRENRIVYANAEAAAIAGCDREEIVGSPVERGIHPDDVEHVRRALAGALAAPEERNTFEFRMRRPDGSDRFVRVDGVLVRDPRGRPATYLALHVDVTEIRLAQQALATRSRLEAMGTLVAGVGHEINNPLAVMIGGEGYVLEILRELLVRLRSPGPPSPPEIAGELEGAVEALSDGLASGQRIARIVKDLALFGQARATEERVRLRDAVDLGLRWLPDGVRSAAHLEVVDAGAPDVVGLSGQLSQMVLNLVSNACRSGGGGRRPHVRVRLGPGAPGKALLEVTDDGVGMAPETLRQIFNPFFTTRPAGDQRGSGLGLSVSQAIAATHGGTITVQSEPGKGSTFRVELPAAS